jgi:hypothetical protein
LEAILASERVAESALEILIKDANIGEISLDCNLDDPTTLLSRVRERCIRAQQPESHHQFRERIGFAFEPVLVTVIGGRGTAERPLTRISSRQATAWASAPLSGAFWIGGVFLWVF